MMTLQELLDAHRAHESLVTVFRGALRRMPPDIIERDAQRQFETLSESNEAIRRLPQSEHKRIRTDIRNETETVRRLAAGVAQHNVRHLHTLARHSRDFVAQASRDTEQDFPKALNGVSADGMIGLALLRVQLSPMLEQLNAAQLFDTYTAALMRKDARGLVEAEIIERLVTTKGRQLAASETDLPLAKKLRDYVEGVMELRVPTDVPDFDSLAKEVDQLNGRAEIAKVRPVDPDVEAVTASAFEQEQAAMTEAGEQSQADYVRELKEAATS